MMVFIALIGMIAVIIALTVLRGFVLSVLWQWFAIPLGLPEISIAHAIGISLVVAMLARDLPSDKDKSDSLENFTKGLISSLLFLAIGWIIHFFM